MSKPLIADPKRQSDAARFHREVFSAHGNACYFCGKHATDAMHIWPRSMLGAKYRYAFPAINGRPGCRACHDGPGKLWSNFRAADVRAARRVLNPLLRSPLPEYAKPKRKLPLPTGDKHGL